ncbi:MAG: hypothetical protein HY704_14300 [Gemmatimonadetes bacterium]|nr:hypothetical protein [Gemmatimonadota bacterium]
MPRRFTDDGDRVWEVVVGRESWGTFYAIFVPSEGGERVRQAPLRGSSHEAAWLELDQMGADELRGLFQRSEVKPAD